MKSSNASSLASSRKQRLGWTSSSSLEEDNTTLSSRLRPPSTTVRLSPRSSPRPKTQARYWLRVVVIPTLALVVVYLHLHVHVFGFLWLPQDFQEWEDVASGNQTTQQYYKKLHPFAQGTTPLHKLEESRLRHVFQPLSATEERRLQSHSASDTAQMGPTTDPIQKSNYPLGHGTGAKYHHSTARTTPQQQPASGTGFHDSSNTTPSYLVYQPPPAEDRNVTYQRKRKPLYHPPKRDRKKRDRRHSKYRHLHRQRPDEKVLYLVHIHKSGGTTLCQLAHSNRLTVNREQNCNVQADQKCCGHDDTAEIQTLYALQTRYDLVAAEAQMYAGMDPRQYNYLVILRNSRHRYLSHWKHILRGLPPRPVKLLPKKLHGILGRHGTGERGMAQNSSQPQQLPEQQSEPSNTTRESPHHWKPRERPQEPQQTLAFRNKRRLLEETPVEEDANVAPRLQQPYLQLLQQQQQQKIHTTTGGILKWLQNNHEPQESPLPPMAQEAHPLSEDQDEEEDYDDDDGNEQQQQHENDPSNGTLPLALSTGRQFITTDTMPRLNTKPDHPPRIIGHPAQVPQPREPQPRGNRVLGFVGATFSQWWQRQPDNWSFRQLCGTRCMRVPKYQLTQEHWNYTLDRFLQFHTVLFIEDLQDSVETLARRLNWTQTNMTVASLQALREDEEKAKRDGSRKSKKAPVVGRPIPGMRRMATIPPIKAPNTTVAFDDWNPLMSVLDDALYDIGKRWERLKQTNQWPQPLLLKDFDTDAPDAIQLAALTSPKNLPAELVEHFENYFHDEPNNHRHQCEHECCHLLCSLW